ncbi:MAG: transposase [Planctomycetaceae bacterium]
MHRDESGVEAIGVDGTHDEVAWRQGHTYLTLAPKAQHGQIDQEMKRLLWGSRDRTERSLSRFFDLSGETIEPPLTFVCRDMWQAM